ncbi:MAG TPA: type II toxin-antitoxin system VapC family toxin [Thermoanaerobaculia bacterium]|jgi:ribonuclease VapC|nr:type II toxin-antitoxin system VapC family toxin [Thermoanaerobaculia bacterium]
MVLDSSALLAILQNEPERRAFNELIERAESRLLSVVSFVETSIVIAARYGPEGLQNLDLFLSRAGVALVEVDTEQAGAAREAFLRFGRGYHPAGLNFGDCFTYALATVRGESLLCKGDDFRLTNVVLAS